MATVAFTHTYLRLRRHHAARCLRRCYRAILRPRWDVQKVKSPNSDSDTRVKLQSGECFAYGRKTGKLHSTCQSTTTTIGRLLCRHDLQRLSLIACIASSWSRLSWASFHRSLSYVNAGRGQTLLPRNSDQYSNLFELAVATLANSRLSMLSTIEPSYLVTSFVLTGKAPRISTKKSLVHVISEAEINFSKYRGLCPSRDSGKVLASSLCPS